jgi:hypothetical protein
MPHLRRSAAGSFVMRNASYYGVNAMLTGDCDSEASAWWGAFGRLDLFRSIELG